MAIPLPSSVLHRHLLRGWAALLCVSPSSAAKAEHADLFGAETISAHFDVRLAGAGGEPSWLDGGFGKARFGGEDGDFWGRPVAAQAALIWQPSFRWDLPGTFVLAAQNKQNKAVDLIEGFVGYRPVPGSATRFSGRVGLFWPPVSLEHEGAAWSVADMITPSAINSWMGEEVKVIGAEATVTRQIAGQRLSGTAAVFGFNDTAGTVLAFRGWALHDLKAGAFGEHPLPPLNPFMQSAQAATTKPVIELDGRPGFYAKLGWAPAAPLTLEAFYYNNRGDPTAVRDGQWGWETRFWNFGARVDVDSRTRLLVQALTGSTEMGYEDAAGYWVETSYRSAYFRLSHRRGAMTLSSRFDMFGTREHGSEMEDGEREDGWAATAAASYELSREAKLLVEALYVDSDRQVRIRAGLMPDQRQTQVQAAVRISL